ncbi:hypothetical protein [Verminephrobacter eiseniae]|uniref:hypothetical protein n=1 Tax=Verminephrobacter eiseniae TaxID=364317 RepID=UPI0010E8D708|nr:hypothetical protein [Verminephrobacter eiseniae]KAB7554187.1 hypothetical protein ET532_023410 [Verminephrobacter sp. Larva24]MCW5234590.1 hypothetical protein [Verminephrobacter eiseniae]MCW5293834.1 hypothetical protein [Verminephrobacter eiseniae]MCW8183841.1 hypothetical protein [Verminephrobacter eiseniae]MCW8222411.1 hypothetical protein [Verminephrobacter eiseniae]
MSKSRFPGPALRGGPALCLDALSYARRVFGNDDEHWFGTPALLAVCRPMAQSLHPDWFVLPLREWVQAWWQAHGRPGQGMVKPRRALQARLEDPRLRAALLDALRALHSAIGSTAGLALQIDGPGPWLSWVGAAADVDALDGADAEDVSVYLAALLHRLAGSGLGALVVQQQAGLGTGPAELYAALTNAAGHHGWPCVLCSATTHGVPRGFDALAVHPAIPGMGLWCNEANWVRQATPGVPFVVARVPAQAAPDDVLAQIARWRNQS